jgi:hypothetical protein
MQQQRTGEIIRADSAVVQELSKETGFSVEEIQKGIVMFGDEPYFTKEMLHALMDHKFGAINWSMETLPPPFEQYQTIRMMAGTRDGENYFVMKTTLHIRGKPSPQIEWGTTHKKNTNMIKSDVYGLELASTRAQNRACRIAIANGLSVNAPYEAPTEAPVDASKAVYPDPPTEPEKKLPPYVPQSGSIQADFLAEAQRLKKKMGDDLYYSTLGSFGFDKSNDTDLMNAPEQIVQVWDALRSEASEETKTEEGEAKQADPVSQLYTNMNDERVPDQWREQFHVEAEDGGIHPERVAWWRKRVDARLEPEKGKTHAQPLPERWWTDVDPEDIDVIDYLARGAGGLMLSGILAKHPALKSKNMKQPGKTDGEVLQDLISEANDDSARKTLLLRAEGAITGWKIRNKGGK